jgi:tetratricopeptide (TPR) repeat protein
VAAARRYWGDEPRIRHQAARARLAAATRSDDPARRDALLADARRALEQIDPEAPDAAPLAVLIRSDLGNVALGEGDVAGAAEAFEQALNLDQDHSAAWVGLAECARLAGDRKRALRLYLRAVTASEWNVRAWERGCSLMEELGFHDNAQSWRTKVHEHFPESPGLAVTTAGP